jgi:hypothetical protein
MILEVIASFAVLGIIINTFYSLLLFINHSLSKRIYECMVDGDIFLIGTLIGNVYFGPAYYLSSKIHSLPILLAKLLMICLVFLLLVISILSIEVANMIGKAF